MAKKQLSRVEQLKKEKENNYMRLAIIVGLMAFVLIGNTNILNSGEVAVTNTFTLFNKSNLNKFKDDVMDYTININKKNIKELDNEIETLVEKINNSRVQLNQYKAEEKQLEALLTRTPVELYQHNKLDLIAFMIEVLKSEDLIYEVNYTYVEEIEEEEVAVDPNANIDPVTGEPIQAEVFEPTINKDLFSISIYQFNSENYQKVLNFLDTIFIREAYSIENVKIDYDKVTESYYLELIIGI